MDEPETPQHTFVVLTKQQLQWGRLVDEPETSEGNDGIYAKAMLQWGRLVDEPETPISERAMLPVAELQWGRLVDEPETCQTAPAGTGTFSFNGAGSWMSRKPFSHWLEVLGYSASMGPARG